MLNNLLPLFALTLQVAMHHDGLTPNPSVSAESALTHQDEKWSGSASCTIKCADSTCKILTVHCPLAVSYSDAERKLRAKIEAEARAQGGKVEGSISFDIKMQF